ncbi:hypothetical protein BKD83_10365 [Corynebacterium diphtheriae]|nr:hypothetical protein BKD83_10365 [Corynebacterium diphtheriae]
MLPQLSMPQPQQKLRRSSKSLTRSTLGFLPQESEDLKKAVETKKYEIVKAKAEKLLQEKADQDKRSRNTR